MLTFDIAGGTGLEEGLEVHDSIVVLQQCSERTFQEEEVAWKNKEKLLAEDGKEEETWRRWFVIAQKGHEEQDTRLAFKVGEVLNWCITDYKQLSAS